MAEKTKTTATKPTKPAAAASQTTQEPEAPKSKFNRIFKILSVMVALCILIVIGFAAGVYLKMIDVEQLTRGVNLAQYPVVNRFFPKTNFEPVDLNEDTTNAQANTPSIPPNNANMAQQPAGNLQSNPLPSTPNAITKEELEQQTKIKQKEEAKRISKLARLYGGMKPEEAVTIMGELDDPTVISILGKMEEEQVSKILSKFDSSRAARITQEMMREPQAPKI